MRAEDAQTLAVFLFEGGYAPSMVDEKLLRRKGFAHDAVVEWWARDRERLALPVREC